MANDITAGRGALASVLEAGRNLTNANLARSQSIGGGISGVGSAMINYAMLSQKQKESEANIDNTKARTGLINKQTEHQGHLNTIAKAKAGNIDKEIEQENDLRDIQINYGRTTNRFLAPKLQSDIDNTKARTGLLNEQSLGLRIGNAKTITEQVDMYNLMDNSGGTAGAFLNNLYRKNHSKPQLEHRFKYGALVNLPKDLK